MVHYSGIVERTETSNKVLTCLARHVESQMSPGELITIIHSGNSDYIRLVHILIAQLLTRNRWVYVFDYQRRIKSVYLQQLLTKQKMSLGKALRKLALRVILDENHAIDELQRLQRRKPSRKKPPVLFVIDPSGLFGRLRGGVKQSAEGLQFQYDAAKLFAQKEYSVVISDFGGRHFHRVESVVPAQLAEAATLVLQFLPRQILLSPR